MHAMITSIYYGKDAAQYSNRLLDEGIDVSGKPALQFIFSTFCQTAGERLSVVQSALSSQVICKAFLGFVKNNKTPRHMAGSI